jgi:hypothetical protein
MAEPTYTSKEVSESKIKAAMGSSMTEGFIGIGAVALAIIGLAGVLPVILLAVATIALGVALAFEGGSISARYAALIEEGEAKKDAARWGGVTSLFLAGVAGITLGILSLIGIVPGILIPVSAIAFGGALILDSGANERLSRLEAEYSEGFKTSESVMRETARTSAGLQVLVGLGAIALGILALVNVFPLVLSLVAMLSIGTVNLITGTIIGGRMATMFR